MKHILIIEDDPVLQFMLRNLFQEVGYSVRSIMDGRDLIMNKHALEADLIILDMMIPHLYESRDLIALYKDEPTPKIVMSSIDVEDGEYFSKQIDAQAFYTKPIKPHDLLKHVKTIFNDINPPLELKNTIQ